MEYSSLEIMDQIMAMEYLLPKQEELIQMLTVRKFAPVCVAQQESADFVTGNITQFLRFLRVNHIKAVLYSYRYYAEQDLEAKFQLEDGEKALFFNLNQASEENRYRLQARSYRLQRPEESDYSHYLRFVKFIRDTVDLRHPKEMRLYGICQGRVLACQCADAWLDRLMIPDGQFIRNYAMQYNLGAGDLTFRFH